MAPRLLAIALLVGSALTWIALGRSNAPGVWIPLSLPLPATAGERIEGRFTADSNGFYELQVEADATLDAWVLAEYIGTTRGPSRLGLEWSVEGPGGPVASGGAARYRYVERGPGSWLARMKRVLLRMPYGRNVAHRRSFGLSGSPTMARGIGRFRATAGTSYSLIAVATTDHAPLVSGNPTIVVRPDRRRWQEHFASVRPLGHAAVLGAVAGCALLAFSFVRRAPGHREG